ncbi:hypothetical protein MIDIC_110018 [Alphaproteobacteria bacterium]
MWKRGQSGKACGMREIPEIAAGSEGLLKQQAQGEVKQPGKVLEGIVQKYYGMIEESKLTENEMKYYDTLVQMLEGNKLPDYKASQDAVAIILSTNDFNGIEGAGKEKIQKLYSIHREFTEKYSTMQAVVGEGEQKSEAVGKLESTQFMYSIKSGKDLDPILKVFTRINDGKDKFGVVLGSAGTDVLPIIPPVMALQLYSFSQKIPEPEGGYVPELGGLLGVSYILPSKEMAGSYTASYDVQKFQEALCSVLGVNVGKERGGK